MWPVPYRAADRPELERLSAFETLVHPVTGARRYLGIPVRVDGCPLGSRAPAPVFDQHSDALVRSWLELDDEGIRALRSGGGMGGRPRVQPKAG